MEDTKTIKTPVDGIEVLIKCWVTGKEKREIESPMTDVKLRINTMGQGGADINVGEARQKVIENSIKTVVLSVNGTKENIVGLIDGLKSPDYDFVLGEIDQVVRGENFKMPSKKQEGTTS